MKRSCLLLMIFLLAGIRLLRADQTTSAVQQALKDQGFFYGDVTGEKNADTTAAIRRYQIRNGLQITGQIDAETLRSLGVGAGAARSTPPKPPPVPTEEETNDGEPPTQSAEISPQEPSANYSVPHGSRGAYGPGPAPGQPRPAVTGVFFGTPYEMAPPDLQRHVIVGAQTLLARYGLYGSGIDGEFGPGTAAAVRGFQARYGLLPDGQLNMPTLAALGLLPGQHRPAVRTSPRRIFRRPIYRGEYVPER